MPKQSTRRLIFAATLASLAALLAIGMTSSFLLMPSSQQEQEMKGIARELSIARPDQYLQEGGKSAIVVEATQKKIELKRGESTTLTFNISHKAAQDGFGVLHVVPAEYQGVTLLPSVLNATTMLERAELTMQGKPIPGAIATSSIVHFSDTIIELRAGETKTIEVIVSLPTSLPDEIVGKSIHFSPKLTISEMADASPDNATDAIVFTDMMTISVVA